jgi:hypothetical protein
MRSMWPSRKRSIEAIKEQLANGPSAGLQFFESDVRFHWREYTLTPARSQAKNAKIVGKMNLGLEAPEFEGEVKAKEKITQFHNDPKSDR